MIVLLSPAKIQDFKPEPPLAKSTQPFFLDEAEMLVRQIRPLSVSALADLLHINPTLARLNADRYGQWHRPFNDRNAKQTVLVFNGEVFHGLDVRTLQTEHLDYLQRHLRICSGLYGILRPFDLIQPYRLDIGDSFVTEDGASLYAFWKEKWTNYLQQDLDRQKGKNILLNLASSEYFKGIDRKKLNARIIDVEFLQHQPKGYQNIVMYTKKARGLMARFVLEQHIEQPEHLTGFNAEGYWYSAERSQKDKLVFIR